MLLVTRRFPPLISMFTARRVTEVMFSPLNGLGLLGYEATVSRDYLVRCSARFISTLIGLLLNISERYQLYAGRSTHWIFEWDDNAAR